MIPLIITAVTWNKKRVYQSPQLEVFLPCCVVVNNCCVVLTTNVRVIEVTLETRFCWTETSLSSQSKVSSASSFWFGRLVTDTKHKIPLGDDLSDLDPKAFDRPFVVSAHLHTLKCLFYMMWGSTSSFSLHTVLKDLVAIHCSLTVMQVFPPSFCESHDDRPGVELQFLLFVCWYTCFWGGWT